jgi:hypothetical protein
VRRAALRWLRPRCLRRELRRPVRAIRAPGCGAALSVSRTTGPSQPLRRRRGRALRTLAASSGVPIVVENTRSNSSSWRPLSALCFSTRQRCFLKASTQRAGNSSVWRDLVVLVSPCAWTDLQRSMVGGLASRLTRDQVNACSSSVRAPVSRAGIRPRRHSSWGCRPPRVGVFRPAHASRTWTVRGCPFGRSHNNARLRLTRSRLRSAARVAVRSVTLLVQFAMPDHDGRRSCVVPGAV